jgi:hypothetical protein
MGVKRPGREADHSPPSSAEVKECVDLYLHSPNTPSWHGAQLQHRDNFYFFTTVLLTHPNKVLFLSSARSSGLLRFIINQETMNSLNIW